MICSKCGKELSDTAKFCPVCGSSVEAGQSDAASSEPASFTVPTGNVISGTLPEADSLPEQNTAADTASTATATMPEADSLPEANSLPEMQGALRAETVRPEKGKFSKKMLIGAGAAAVCVIGGIIVVSGLTFAKADFTHTFMGNKKYATAVMGQQLEKVVNTPALTSAMSAAGSAANSGDNEEDAAASIVSSLASMKSAIPAAGAEIELSVSADLSDDNLAEFAKGLECEPEKAKEIIEAIQALKVKAGVQFTETGIAGQAVGSEGGTELIKVNALYDADSEAYYISVPAVSDECLMIADEKAVIDMEDLNPEETDDKASKEMVENVLKAYKDSLDDAEIVYEKTTFSIGDVEFKGKMSSVTLEDEALTDMLSNVSDEFFDSEYADNLGDASSMQTSVDRVISDLEEVDGLKLTIDNFMNTNNTVAGMRVEFEGKNGGSKTKGEVAYLETKDGFACSVEADGKTVFEFSQEKENKSTGKFTGKIGDGSQTGKFTIDYENYKEKDMLGQKVALGDYTIKFSGDMFSTGDMPIEKITLKVSDEDNKLNYDIGVKADGSTISAKMALSEGIGEKIDAETMKISDAYDAISEDNKAKVNKYKSDLIVYLSEKTKDSEFCKAVPYNDGTLADYLQATAQRALRETELPKNYAAYNENTVFEAKSAASQIYSNVNRISFNFGSSSEKKIKLYYDKDGKLSILDNAGMSPIENQLLENLGGLGYKNMYAEIVVWPKRGPLCGVNVVMTDKSSNVPANLPNAYNFKDRQYNWGTNEDVNFIGSFVVGTYPKLNNGEGGKTKENDDKLAESVKTLNAAAEKAAKVMSDYNGLTFTEGKRSFIEFSYSTYNNNWQYNYKNGEINGSLDIAAEFLTEKLGKIDANYVCFYYDGSKLTGTTASNGSYESSFAIEDFERGNTDVWGYLDGAIGEKAVGTYPSLSRMTTLPKEYANAIAGTWARGTEKVTFTDNDLKNFTIYRSYGTISYINILTADNKNYTYYPNGDEPYITNNRHYGRFTKQ